MSLLTKKFCFWDRAGRARSARDAFEVGISSKEAKRGRIGTRHWGEPSQAWNMSITSMNFCFLVLTRPACSASWTVTRPRPGVLLASLTVTRRRWDDVMACLQGILKPTFGMMSWFVTRHRSLAVHQDDVMACYKAFSKPTVRMMSWFVTRHWDDVGTKPCRGPRRRSHDELNEMKSRHRRIKKQRRYERLAATSQLSLCGNFSDTSSFKFRRSKGSLGHAFTVRIRTGNQNQTSFYPSVLHEISVLVELILGHLRYLLTDVPPQPNSPPDNVFRPDRPAEAGLGSQKEGHCPASDSRNK
ncbi:hypothetical protein L1987_87916 [Smallanthus sonchifolius]|nr:hypothetical protein L1987_87916 [Smallanthus sonchifolius]